MDRDTDRQSDTVDATAPAAHDRAPRLSLPTYEIGALIGKGGMGEVLLAYDPKIGREVAIKHMAGGSPTDESTARFLREAKIQARLEHPSIVPVHELGRDTEGRPYFTMRRLAGTTLLAVLGDPDAKRQRMLRAVIDVCHAIELAHERGVVHRDLKPANIMLGAYGEVFVLDWGIARVLTDDDGVGNPGDIDTLEGQTAHGEMLGTPGYMAPEQMRGDADVGPAADVYSIGAILFEILAGESLHPRDQRAVQSTLNEPTQSPSARRPDRAIPLELENACFAALAASPQFRPSVREVGERIQKYLDGDLDLEKRRELAASCLATAREAASDPARREEALRSSGRALALDRESNDAADLVARLLLEPPVELPAELVRNLEQNDMRESERASKVGSIALLTILTFVPFAIWAGIKSWPWLVGLIVLVLLGVVYAQTQARVRRPNDLLGLIIVGILATCMSRVLGSFVFIPGLIAVLLMLMGQQAMLLERPYVPFAVGLAAFVTPLVLELVGVFEPTWAIAGDQLTISSELLHLHGIPAYVILIGPNFAIIAITAWFVRSLAVSRREAQRTLEIRAWHLAKLMPVEPSLSGAGNAKALATTTV